MSLLKKNIFVIGGSGFLGSYLVRHMLDCQENVYYPTSKAFNLTDKSTWRPLNTLYSAAIICVSEISKDPQSMKRVNEDPLKDLYEYLKKNGIHKIIYISSGAVYGAYQGIVTSETPCNPDTFYGISKLKSEEILSSICQDDLNILRLYFPYGAGQKIPRFIPQIINNIRSHKSILCNQDGGPYMNVTHIKDLVNIIYSDFVKKNNQQIRTNIASPFILSVKEIAEKLSKSIGIPALFAPNLTQKSDTISEPYPFSEWKYSGNFEDMVHQ